jgi:glycosyltransferase involved in cell wall biosynthesis
MAEPLVTVVTPSYNQGRFIRATIESVLSQDYPHVEYIIMDGGSTDETAAVVKDYAGKLTFISEPDRGQSHAINKGFRLARGTIVSWLNSDDVYLPGAIRKAVDGFTRNPVAGAVYGEGYLMDREGRISCRFPHTEPLNLWKLVYLSDYILQQTVFFRRDVLDDVGDLDEDLHYSMDWDILIRIASKYPLEYIPEYMGCLREYEEAKSSAGGKRRIRELRMLLRRHTGLWLPPGYVVYGLDTYHRIWCDAIERMFAPALKPVSAKLQSLVRLAAGLIISYTARDSQGLYSDAWAARRLHFMLPPGTGPLIIEGTLPDWGKTFERQRLRVTANRRRLGEFPVPVGEFQLVVDIPPDLQRQLLRLTIQAKRWLMPGRFTLRGDRRRLAYRFGSIRWSQPAEARPLQATESAALPHTAGA